MSFQEVIGHHIPVKILQNALRQGRLGVSYLFYGPSGVGKSFIARQFGKGINCQRQGVDCCDCCIACLKAEKREYPDLHWFDIQGGSQNIKIEQIRQLQEGINFKPFEGKAKVFVINNCQSLTEEAANCLLKVIEEPPLDSVIVLLATDMRLVLPTIASRCQKIRFSPLRRQEVEGVLQQKYRLDGTQSRFLASYAGGKLGDALSLSNDDFLTKRDSILSVTVLSAVRGNFEDAFKDPSDAQQALSILLSWFRDVLFAKLAMPEFYLINQDKASEIKRQAGRYSSAHLLAILDTLSKGFEYLKNNINLKLLSDVLIEGIQWKS